MYFPIYKTVQNQVEKVRITFYFIIEVYDENIDYKYK